jgi:DNA polymerase beta
MDHTTHLLELLEILKKKEVTAKEPFKAKAYSNVIKNIKYLGKPIYNIDDLNNVKGIGPKIHEKISEYFETGKMKAVENANNNPANKIVEELTRVHGIGPSKALSLYENNGIKTLDDLEKNAHLLNDKQIMGLKYYKDFEQRIPRAEMDVHHKFLGQCIKSVDPMFEFEITGSYRRMQSSSGDIDILITHKNPPKNIDELFKLIIQKLKDDKYIVDVFAEGGKKCLAVCKLKRYKRFRRIDLLFANKREYPFALLYFTGDATFNVNMRSYCQEKGYSLSEHGLKDEKTNFFVEFGANTESDIFNFLGLQYVEPRNRKNGAIIEV